MRFIPTRLPDVVIIEPAVFTSSTLVTGRSRLRCVDNHLENFFLGWLGVPAFIRAL